MNMKKHRLPAVCAGIFASVTSAFAAVRTLPTPGPSGYVDRESSVVVAFPTNLGRQVAMTLAAPFAPTNALEVGLGWDRNGNGDLEPEETEVRMGVDCGVSQVKVERNCIFASNNGGDMSADSAAYVAYSRFEGATGSDNVSGDPKFRRPAKGDYTPKSGSACIDNGDNSVWADETEPVDIMGRRRVVCGKVDLGAFEQNGGGLTLIVR